MKYNYKMEITKLFGYYSLSLKMKHNFKENRFKLLFLILFLFITQVICSIFK
jgi:hypothetical protein